MLRLGIVALLFIAPLAVSSSAAPEIEFGEPSTFWGSPVLESTGRVEMANVIEEGFVSIWVDEGTVIRETRSSYAVSDSEANTGTFDTPFNPESEYEIESAGWIDVERVPRAPSAFLTTFNALSTVEMHSIDASIWTEGTDWLEQAEHGKEFHDAYREAAMWSGSGVFIATPEPSPLDLVSQRATKISWANGIVSCREASPCPSSDNIEPTKADSRAQYEEYVHVHVLQPAEVRIDAHQSVNYLLAESWSAAAKAARLPGASGELCQPVGCDGEKTIRLDGEFTIAGLSRTDKGRMSGTIHGDIQNLIVDETPMDPALIWGVTAGTVAATAIMAGIASKLGLFSLFTRISAEKALEHPRRQLLYSYISESPGATFRELVRATGVPAGTTRHHLNVLRRCELVVEKPHKSTLRFFENHGKFDHSWDTVVMLREEPLLQLHSWLVQHPESNQKNIIAAMEQEGCSRGTTQHRLSRLLDAGLVTLRQQGRFKLYTAHDEPVQPQMRTNSWNGLDASWPPRYG